jgi:site-specific DNA-methyltransferase (adenine-specific)
MLDNINYNPDVLTCLANLSNDEVFTPPELVNDILDLLPKELFENKETTFLDPVTKSGVFLREIAKRLMDGLEGEIPDQQARINHIFKKQIFGIAITELTSLLARRSVYCSKEANGKYSICEDFETEQGNILFERIEHTWKSGKCQFCGASKKNYARGDELETHAYQFIHTGNPKELFKMKFDVIIGNPPYQLDDGGFGKSASPIYHKFVEQSIKLNPRFISMIIPARWYSGGKGLSNFRDKMLNDRRISTLHDFPETSDCFPGLNIRGGVCYFLWESGHTEDCKITTHKKDISSKSSIRPMLEKSAGIFVRYNEAVAILDKVKKFQEKPFKENVSPQKPFGMRTYVKGKNKPFKNSVKLYQNGGIGYIDKVDITKNYQWVGQYKVIVPRSSPGSDVYPHMVIGSPILSEPNSCCTETYIVIGPFVSKSESKSVISYMKTKFFRFLMVLIKNTQDVPQRVYGFVPNQNFDELWTDEKLYTKYGISKDEQNFIDTLIRPMELDNE